MTSHNVVLRNPGGLHPFAPLRPTLLYVESRRSIHYRGVQMDDSVFKDRVKRLKEANAVIKQLDPAIRSAAFELLSGYVSQGDHGAPSVQGGSSSGKHTGGASVSAGSFFAKQEHTTPAENVWLVVAFLYSRYGRESFTLEDIRAVAKDEGLNLPDRFNSNLQAKKWKDKPLCTSAGYGKFRLTAHGARYVEETYKIRAGREQKAESAE